jgi:hypothetical protein
VLDEPRSFGRNFFPERAVVRAVGRAVTHGRVQIARQLAATGRYTVTDLAGVFTISRAAGSAPPDGLAAGGGRSGRCDPF